MWQTKRTLKCMRGTMDLGLSIQRKAFLRYDTGYLFSVKAGNSGSFGDMTVSLPQGQIEGK